MPVFAIIGFLVMFIPIRCTTQQIYNTVNDGLNNNKYYYYYDGPVHEIDKTTGKEIGIIPKNTLLYGINKDKFTLDCYKLVNGKPVRTFVKEGNDTGEAHQCARVGYYRRYFRFWKYQGVTPIDTQKDLFKQWDAYYKTFSDMAKKDALALFEEEFKKVKISEHMRDDFDNVFLDSVKGNGYYQLISNTYAPFNDKSKFYYIHESERTRLLWIRRKMRKLYREKFEEYVQVVSFDKASYSEFDISYPFEIKKF